MSLPLPTQQSNLLNSSQTQVACLVHSTPIPDDAIIKEIERAIVDHCTGGDLWMSASLAKDRIKRLLSAAQGEKP